MLPIDAILSDLVAALRKGFSVVLKAPPGAGKTTGIPPALIADESARSGQILLVQPRRLAARAAASRLAQQDRSDLGSRIGYHVRFDRRAGRRSRLIAVTPGILLRRLQSDPLLDGVATIILDEFHERSIELDLCLGMLQRVRTTLRPELQIIVMSATLDPQPIVEFLGDAVGLHSEGRAFDVTVEYLDQPADRFFDRQLESSLPAIWRRTDGDVLVFLPGLSEIRRSAATLESLGLDADICQLYGDLPVDRQDAILAPSRTRKIILATNIAETSITIPGVTAVIDGGLARVMRFDRSIGLPRLQLEPISLASARQRAGRAGRTRPGICLRLWTATQDRGRRKTEVPEILRGDLTSLVLTLLAWGEKQISEFTFLTPPPEESVRVAERLLRQLGAIDGDRSVTSIGSRMLAMPVHPRMARCLIAAESLGAVEAASIAAALLTERDPFRESDPNLEFPEKVDRLLSGRGPRSQASRQIARVAKQLRRDLDVNAKPTDDAALTRSLLAGYPDRVAQRRGDDDRGVMVGRRGVRLPRTNRGAWALCVDVDGRGVEANVRQAVAIDPSWLAKNLIRESEDYSFDDQSESVIARRRTLYEDLLLHEVPITCRPGPAVARILRAAVADDVTTAMPPADHAIHNFLKRVRFLSEHLPDNALPKLTDEELMDLAGQFCETRTSLAQLRSAPWLEHVRGKFTYEQTQTVEREAPGRVQLPSGSSAAVRYASEGPTIAARIQELFGWSSTPRIAGGRVPLRLELLGPNLRPQQITDDLASFWTVTYAQVRKDLRGRYPKHHWPEDPTTAAATPNGLKPR